MSEPLTAASTHTRTDYVVELAEAPPHIGNHFSTRYARVQNSLIAWTETEEGAQIDQTSSHESFVILPDSAAHLASGASKVQAPARSICIMPAGYGRITMSAPGRLVRIFSPVPDDLAQYAINAASYLEPRAGVRPLGQPMTPRGTGEIRVYPIDEYRQQAGKRPVTFQTGTMNVMWIEQDDGSGPRTLNPHDHSDFEEAALVLFGEFIEHLRTPWTPEKSLWREDEHVACGPGTLITIPPLVTHATETRGPGPHVMLNVFSPARQDHIASGMALNASDYA